MPQIKQIKQHKLLLDTHVWLWILMGDSRLAVQFCQVINRCHNPDHLFISPISIWEVGMLVERKRIELEMDCLDWIEQALDNPGITLAQITPRIAIQSTRIPGSIHGDPADRLLVASARELNAVLVTHDQQLLKFGKGKFINVYDPCR